ncbi:energy-converting NiFe hydrogenase A subunit EhaA [Methanotorris formicicus]|nr:energy-converting NiFe hydrogenase A subunit EhaA [Methanotorris formicicus]
MEYYVVSVIASIIFALIMKVPIIPKERPIRDTFETSVLFPTPIIALGLTAVDKVLFTPDLMSCVLIGLISALFSKFSDGIFG